MSVNQLYLFRASWPAVETDGEAGVACGRKAGLSTENTSLASESLHVSPCDPGHDS